MNHYPLEEQESFSWNEQGRLLVIAAKVVHQFPFLFKGKIIIDCDPSVFHTVVPTNEQIQTLIIFYIWKILEDNGYDRYGIIDATRRLNTFICTNGEAEPAAICGPRYPSLHSYWQAVYSNPIQCRGKEYPGISYKVLRLAEKKIEELEISGCNELFKILKRDHPEEMKIYSKVTRHTPRKEKRTPSGVITSFWAGPEMIWYPNLRSYKKAIGHATTN